MNNIGLYIYQDVKFFLFWQKEKKHLLVFDTHLTYRKKALLRYCFKSFFFKILFFSLLIFFYRCVIYVSLFLNIFHEHFWRFPAYLCYKTSCINLNPLIFRECPPPKGYFFAVFLKTTVLMNFEFICWMREFVCSARFTIASLTLVLEFKLSVQTWRISIISASSIE